MNAVRSAWYVLQAGGSGPISTPMRNDVSFLFEQTMNLWEQQSTQNPNMPLRFLLYYAHVMERYVHGLPQEAGNVYSSALVQLPIPRMILFYNGPGRMPEYLYLSRAYGAGTDSDVEVRVKVFNIGTGQDRILELCQPLQDYTTFVEAFHRYRKMDGISNSAAASRAIAELPAGAVKNYLDGHRAEVIDMLLTEYDENKTLAAEYCAGERAGLQKGRAQEQREALSRLMDHAAKGELSVAAATVVALDYGVVNETDFRERAAAQGVQLPE